MNKQVEEMAKDIEFCDRNLVANCHNVKCKECRYFYSKEDCYMLRLSEMLIAKGYRKTADVAKEIFAEIKAMPIAKDFTRKSQDFEFGYRLATQEILAELKKKYESEGADDDL